MIYYNNKKIIKAYYGTKNIFPFEDQYIKNVGTNGMYYDVSVYNDTGISVDSYNRYYLVGGEQVKISSLTLPANKKYGLTFYYPDSEFGLYGITTYLTDDNAKTHYYELTPMSKSQAMNKEYNNEDVFSKYTTKPTTWDDTFNDPSEITRNEKLTINKLSDIRYLERYVYANDGSYGEPEIVSFIPNKTTYSMHYHGKGSNSTTHYRRESLSFILKTTYIDKISIDYTLRHYFINTDGTHELSTSSDKKRKLCLVCDFYNGDTKIDSKTIDQSMNQLEYSSFNITQPSGKYTSVEVTIVDLGAIATISADNWCQICSIINIR